MAKDPRTKAGAGGGGNVVDIGRACCGEDCKKTATRAEYCEEHFTWFKEGLITKEGRKPRDFDKKYQDFMNRRKTG